MRSRSLPFKIGSSIDSYSDMVESNSVDSNLVDSDLVDSDIVDLDLVDSDLVESDSKSCGYPVQLYKVLIFFTSNLDNSPSFLSLKVTKFQKEFWISFYVLKMSKISVCQPFCSKTAQMESTFFNN